MFCLEVLTNFELKTATSVLQPFLYDALSLSAEKPAPLKKSNVAFRFFGLHRISMCRTGFDCLPRTSQLQVRPSVEIRNTKKLGRFALGSLRALELKFVSLALHFSECQDYTFKGIRGIYGS